MNNYNGRDVLWASFGGIHIGNGLRGWTLQGDLTYVGSILIGILIVLVALTPNDVWHRGVNRLIRLFD